MNKKPTAKQLQARTMRRSAIVAGVAMLIMAGLAAFANFGALQPLLDSSDTAQTATDIMGSAGLFHLAVIGFLLVVVLDVVVAIALHRYFSPVDRYLSRFTAMFRIVYALVFLVAISQLASISLGIGLASLATPSQFEIGQKLEAFQTIWMDALVLFGIHLALLARLAWRSTYVPTWLAVLLLVAGLGYLIDSIVYLAAEGYMLNISAGTFVGEVALIFWLLIWGIRATPTADKPITRKAS